MLVWHIGFAAVMLAGQRTLAEVPWLGFGGARLSVAMFLGTNIVLAVQTLCRLVYISERMWSITSNDVGARCHWRVKVLRSCA